MTPDAALGFSGALVLVVGCIALLAAGPATRTRSGEQRVQHWGIGLVATGVVSIIVALWLSVIL